MLTVKRSFTRVLTYLILLELSPDWYAACSRCRQCKIERKPRVGPGRIWIIRKILVFPVSSSLFPKKVRVNILPSSDYRSITFVAEKVVRLHIIIQNLGRVWEPNEIIQPIQRDGRRIRLVESTTWTLWFRSIPNLQEDMMAPPSSIEGTWWDGGAASGRRKCIILTMVSVVGWASNRTIKSIFKWQWTGWPWWRKWRWEFDLGMRCVLQNAAQVAGEGSMWWGRILRIVGYVRFTEDSLWNPGSRDITFFLLVWALAIVCFPRRSQWQYFGATS